MDNNKVEFELIPESSNNIRVLGGLVFDKRAELGDGAYLDLTKVPGYP